MSIATAPATVGAERPRRVRQYDAATTAWLAGEDPPRLSPAALLHPEVRHAGACYAARTLRASLIGVPIAAVADVAYALGRLQNGHPFDAQPLGPVWTTVALLAGVGLVVLAALVRHALWHRAEAPYAHNVVHEVPPPWQQN